jgi:hypothetical protein
MPGLEPRSQGSLAPRSGSPAKRAPGKIPYEVVERAGFDVVPDAVQDALWAASVLIGTMWLGTGDLVTKRRSDGSHFQHLRAWWASELRFVTFNAIRELTPTGEGRFRPQGGWTTRGTAFDFPSPRIPASSVWRLAASEQAGSEPRRVRRNAGPLEVLPPQVASPVVGGEADAWREHGRGWAAETIVACKVKDNKVRLLKATREATSRRALDRADWNVETLDSQVETLCRSS